MSNVVTIKLGSFVSVMVEEKPGYTVERCGSDYRHVRYDRNGNMVSTIDPKGLRREYNTDGSTAYVEFMCKDGSVSRFWHTYHADESVTVVEKTATGQKFTHEYSSDWELIASTRKGVMVNNGWDAIPSNGLYMGSLIFM